MHRILLVIILMLVAGRVAAADLGRPEEQKVLYAVGLVMAKQLSVFNLTAEELEIVKQGVTDGVSGRTALRMADPYARLIQELAEKRREAEGMLLAHESKLFLEQAEKMQGAVKTASGMIYLSRLEGTGGRPKAGDQVSVHYRGLLINGKEFDNSYLRGKPVEVPVTGTVRCWTEGLLMMNAGGRARMVCPPELGHGSRSSGLIPANAVLIYEVELLDVIPAK